MHICVTALNSSETTTTIYKHWRIVYVKHTDTHAQHFNCCPLDFQSPVILILRHLLKTYQNMVLHAVANPLTLTAITRGFELFLGIKYLSFCPTNKVTALKATNGLTRYGHNCSNRRSS